MKMKEMKIFSTGWQIMNSHFLEHLNLADFKPVFRFFVSSLDQKLQPFGVGLKQPKTTKYGQNLSTEIFKIKIIFPTVYNFLAQNKWVPRKCWKSKVSTYFEIHFSILGLNHDLVFPFSGKRERDIERWTVVNGDVILTSTILHQHKTQRELTNKQRNKTPNITHIYQQRKKNIVKQVFGRSNETYFHSRSTQTFVCYFSVALLMTSF